MTRERENTSFCKHKMPKILSLIALCAISGSCLFADENDSIDKQIERLDSMESAGRGSLDSSATPQNDRGVSQNDTKRHVEASAETSQNQDSSLTAQNDGGKTPANNREKIYKLDTIRTTETGYLSEEVLEHKGTINVISRSTLEKGAVRNIDEALQRIPGVQIRDYSGTGVLPKISVRGFGGQGNGHSNTGLILLDGVNIYGAPYSNIELAIFPITTNMVERIEVTKGAQGLWAGPNTFSGVINIISKPIPKEWESEISEKVTFWAPNFNTFRLKQSGKPFGSNMLYDTYIRTGGHITENFGVQGQVNIISGQSFRTDTPQNIQNYKLDAVWNLSENQSLKGYVQYYEFYSKLAGALSPEDFKIDNFQNTHPHDATSGPAFRVGLTYDYDFYKDKLNGNLSVTYFFHNISRNFRFDNNFNMSADDQYHLPTGTNKPTEIRDNVRTFVVNGITPKLTLEIDSGFLKQKIITGASYYSEQIGAITAKTTIATGVTTGQNDVTLNSNHFGAVHVSDEITLWDNLTITPGLRYDLLIYHQAYNKPNAKNATYHEISGGLNIGYTFFDSLLVYANYNRSFLPQQNGRIPAQDINFNQHANVAEIGARYNMNSELVASLAYFFIYVDNQAVNVNGMQRGVGATRSQGIELDAYYTPSFLEGLQVHFGYNFIDARQLAPANRGKFLPYVSPHQIIFDVAYNFGKTTLAYSSYFYSSAFGDLANKVEEDMLGKEGKLPAYYVANIQVSRPLYESGKHRLIGSLQVNNIFDYRYWFRGDGTSPIGRYTAPGRSYSAQLRYLF